MTAIVINGKEIAAQIRTDLKEQISNLPSQPRLDIILAGDNDASMIYVRNKLKAAEEIGIKAILHTFDKNVGFANLADLICELNQNHDVNGIIIQLPLPRQINEQEILNMIDPAKDVDGFHPYNIGRLQCGNPEALVSATPKGILRLLQKSKISLDGKNALVIGRSQIVGKPTAMLLLNHNCTVTIAHSHTTNLPELVAKADIVIAACGCPKLIKGNWIKPHAILIDVGINRENGKLCGDIDFETARLKADYITPVPNGVGPMTIAMLLENTIEAYHKQNS